MILLPGVTDTWPRDPKLVVPAAVQARTSILFERWLGKRPAWVAHDAAGKSLNVEIYQSFGNSSDANRDPGLVDALLAACGPGGERTIALAGLGVGLLCCGENNVLCNAQSDGNRVSVRHRGHAPIFPHVSVVFNGAHSNMGNWGKLDRRFEYLSSGRRLSLYATNNEVSSWRSALRAWFDGVKLADGEETYNTPIPVKMVEDPRDRYRALVVTLAPAP